MTEPRDALGARAVGELVGFDVSLASALERVVTDRLGRADRLLDIAGLVKLSRLAQVAAA